MKKTLIFLLALMLSYSVQAQDAKKFDPEKFDTEQQQFIIRQAGLSEQESAKFFPLFREMKNKQRALYDSQRKLGFKKPADDKACEQAIQQHDKIDVELKQIQQSYHAKFLTVIPASKLYDVLKAEERFYRQQLRSWGGGPRPDRPKGTKPDHTR